MILNEYLKESANLIYNKSQELCKYGIMDEDCKWYHSIWQYLRLFNMVSSPTWHDMFYKEELTNALTGVEEKNILISGTADYSLLAYVLYAIKMNRKSNVNIYVLDTCKTPLYSCKWFAEKENIKIQTININLLKYNKNNYFDLICTDAFLTRFNKKIVPKVINKWYELLKINGKIITTIRIYEKGTELSKEKRIKLIDEYKNKAEKNFLEYKDCISFPDDFVQMAEKYVKKMTSNNLGDTYSIIKLFDKYAVKYSVKTTPGELEKTKYLELVAKK